MIRPPKVSEVLSRYRSDKNAGVPHCHNYADRFYDDFLCHYRWCEAVLEVGILWGESLRCWREFFPDALIVGVDFDRSRLISEDRIECHQVDCSDADQLHRFAVGRGGQFSVIIDDGSHVLEHQLLTFRCLLPCLKAGGLFVVEDVQRPEYRSAFEALGLTVAEWDTDRRSDNRIAYFLNTED